jgi:hypothetical protein
MSAEAKTEAEVKAKAVVKAIAQGSVRITQAVSAVCREDLAPCTSTAASVAHLRKMKRCCRSSRRVRPCDESAAWTNSEDVSVIDVRRRMPFGVIEPTGGVQVNQSKEDTSRTLRSLFATPLARVPLHHRRVDGDDAVRAEVGQRLVRRALAVRHAVVDPRALGPVGHERVVVPAERVGEVVVAKGQSQRGSRLHRGAAVQRCRILSLGAMRDLMRGLLWSGRYEWFG